jgi:hypothetical protein
MIDSAVQLTFPCPACGSFLTLRTFHALGPCPSCQNMLTVDLNVTVQGAPTAAPQLPQPGKKFNDRRFRPVAQPNLPQRPVH